MKTHLWGGCSAAVLVIGVVAYGQVKHDTVLDGVYTEQQAQRGEDRYDATCASCHEGDEPEAAAPKGLGFIEQWREAPVSFLYNFIHANMPGNKPGSLSETEYVDLIAYLLRANGYPAGATDLTAANTHNILLVGPDGPKPLPISALVSAVGCLATNPDGDWILTSGAGPTRVRVGDQTTPEELSVSRVTPPGQAAYKLINAEDFFAAKLKGHKVQAKGVLTKVVNPYSLSAQSLESVGEACD
jgi:mono/diheme cytochrome c family protein